MRRLTYLLTGSGELTPRNMLLAGLLVLGFVLFLVSRRPAVYQDFIPLYTGASCLIHGHDPYIWTQQQQQLVQVGGPWTDADYWKNFQIVYPPLTYLLLSPIALLHWPQAALLWRLFNALTYGAGAMVIIHATRPRFRWLAVLMVAAILATSQIVLIMGQITMIDIGLLALGCALILRNRLTPGFVSLCVAVALKPQLGGLILAYFLVSRRTRWPAAVTLVLLATTSVTAGLWFSHRPQTKRWPAELKSQIAAGQAPGGSLDSRSAPPAAANEMLNLQVLTSLSSQSPAVVNRAAWAIAGLTGGCLLLGVFRIADGYERDCLAIAALAMLSLTFMYHRLYDMRMVLLTVPALVLVTERSRRWGACLVTLSGLLLFSTSLVVMRLIGERGREITAHHVVLQIFLARQQALAVILLTLAYTALCWKFASWQACEESPANQGAVLVTEA